MKFITFGCWNKGDPDNPNLPLNWLYEKINEVINDQKDIEFIMITGDNYYYHHKDEKYDKTLKQLRHIDLSFKGQAGGGSDYCNYTDLKRSFDRLNELDIPIYMCAGNHEYKNHKIVSKDNEESPPTVGPSEPSEPQPGDKIDLIYHEKQLLEVKDGEKTNNHFIVEGELKQKSKEILFYVIDTTNFEDYPVITIPEGKKKLYIFGHVPIISLKHIDKKERVKKGKVKQAEKDEWQCMSKLVKWIHNMELPEKIELYYICADTHNYQEIDITLSNKRVIHQVVVGSGGTFDMDKLGEYKQITQKKDNKYEFIPCKSDKLNNLISHVKLLALTGLHGFCLVDTDTKINHFIPFFNAELGEKILPSKAGKKKTKRKKTKRRKTRRKH